MVILIRSFSFICSHLVFPISFIFILFRSYFLMGSFSFGHPHSIYLVHRFSVRSFSLVLSRSFVLTRSLFSLLFFHVHFFGKYISQAFVLVRWFSLLFLSTFFLVRLFFLIHIFPFVLSYSFLSSNNMSFCLDIIELRKQATRCHM